MSPEIFGSKCRSPSLEIFARSVSPHTATTVPYRPDRAAPAPKDSLDLEAQLGIQDNLVWTASLDEADSMDGTESTYLRHLLGQTHVRNAHRDRPDLLECLVQKEIEEIQARREQQEELVRITDLDLQARLESEVSPAHQVQRDRQETAERSSTAHHLVLLDLQERSDLVALREGRDMTASLENLVTRVSEAPSELEGIQEIQVCQGPKVPKASPDNQDPARTVKELLRSPRRRNQVLAPRNHTRKPFPHSDRSTFGFISNLCS